MHMYYICTACSAYVMIVLYFVSHFNTFTMSDCPTFVATLFTKVMKTCTKNIVSALKIKIHLTAFRQR